jgi:hypothetical protein
MKFLLSEMAETTRAIDASLVVVFIPARGESSPAPTQLSSLSPQLGFHFLDLTQPMRANSAASLYLPDGHPNRAGHRLIAEHIASFLSQPQ